MRSFLALLVVLPALAAGLQVSLEHIVGEKAGDKIIVSFEVLNNGEEELRYLKHNTPFESFRETFVGDPFEIVLQETGQHALYLGILMKHLEPTEADYFVLAPGEKEKVFIDLSSGYQMNAKGTYVIRAVDSTDELTITLTTGDDELEQQDFEYSEFENATELVNCGIPNILTNCRAGDQTAIRNSWVQASQCLPSLPVYRSPNPGDANTNRWLGGNAVNLGTVQAGYQRCQSLLCRQGSYGNGARASCDYGCSAYAYVYPTDSTFTIYLCSAYFRAPATGRDSKFGTVIHEAMHFNPIHGARDVQYGCVGCQTLARNNPNGARSNSDSLEFNAEFSGFFTPVPNC